MNLNDYQKQALKSIAITQKGGAALAHRTLGLSGEAGVVANELKKVIRDKDGVATPEDIAVVKKRLGDVLYYVAALGDYFDLTLEEIAKQNLEQSEAFAQKRTSPDA